MLNSIIPGFDSELDSINEISTKGNILAFNVSFKGPEHFYSSFPVVWRDEYEAASLHFSDPTVIWSLMYEGDVRWSEIKLPDIRGVFKKAQVHDLNYGAIFSRKVCNSKTILSVSRDDRELTEAEMQSLAKRWDRLSNLVVGRGGLSDKEIDVLALARDGANYTEISNELNISVGTVKSRIHNAKGKLGARSLTHAVSIAVMRKYFTE